MTKRTMAFVAVSIAFLLGPVHGQEAGPSTLDLSSADYALRQFEKAVESAAGRKIEPGYYGDQARTQIEGLKSRFPDHPKVKDLAARLDAALRAAKGDSIEVTPEMLAYRKLESKLVDVLAAAADAEWKARLEKHREDERAILDPFPAPDPRGTSFSEMKGRVVVLEGFRWPRNQFTNNGINYAYVGNSSQGFYYVAAACPSFLAAYGAVNRYRSSVSRDLPEAWVVEGRITSVRVMVPEAGARASAKAHAGYVVEPVALYVPGRFLAVCDEEGRGSFSSEERLPGLLAAAYSITEVPDSVSPERLIEVMATAVKEKNFPLFLECLPEKDRESPAKRPSIEYLWGQFQKRFAERYVHIEVQKLEDIEAHRPAGSDGPVVEKLRAWVRVYDEEGKVLGSPRPVILIRTEGGRWSIESGYPF